MAFQRLGAVALTLLSAASAFQGTSPLFLFSSSEQLSSSFESTQIAASSRIASQLEDIVSKCSYRNYIVVSQPGAASSDFAGQQSAPHLRRWMVEKQDHVASSVTVPEVAGHIDSNSLMGLAQKKCGATLTKVDTEAGYISIEGKAPHIIGVEFSALPLQYAKRSVKLAEHDSFLNAVISSLHDSDFIVIYATTPPAGELQHTFEKQELAYEMDEPYPSAMHMELRRDMEARAKNSTENLGLFDKYQFLSPGIFMALTVSIPLLLILYVGIYAVASLEVSYFAFSKEMGPSAQKKQG